MFVCIFVQEGKLMCVCEKESREDEGVTWGCKGAGRHRDTVDKI